MKFKLLSGSYSVPGNKSYKRGEVVESDIDLIAKFGAECFACLDARPAVVGFETPPPPPPELPVEDITAEFSTAADADMKVTRTGDVCSVYDDNGVLMDDALSYDKIEQFILDFFESESE